MTSYRTMNFRCDDNKLLKKHEKLWERITSITNKVFCNKFAYNDDNNSRYIKTKIREFGDIIRTHFYNNKVPKVPKVKTSYKCLSLIKLVSILGVKETLYYSQTLLEECKYDVKNIKGNRRIDYDFEKSSSDKSDNEPESETDSESDDDKFEKFSKKYDNNESEKSFVKSDDNESEKSSKKI